MKVAIWGSYNHGNYGDDLMAVMFSLHLKKIGYDPIVFRLTEKIALSYDIETTEKIDELIDGSCFCIIGGGAWLSTKGTPQEVENDCQDFHRALEYYNCPFYCISIGGDGCSDFSKLSRERQSLFKSKMFKGGTVRLRTDVKLLASLPIDISFHNDIVFLASDFFESHRNKLSSKKLFKIGLNLNKNQYKYVKIFKSIGLLSKNIKICFFTSHLEELSPGFEIGRKSLIFKNDKKSEFIEYSELESYITKMLEMDYLVSFKLHLGITALGGGVRFISLGGSGKTIQQLKELRYGLLPFVLVKLLYGIFIFLTLRHKAIKAPCDLDIDSIKKDAEFHFKYIESIKDTY